MIRGIIDVLLSHAAGSIATGADSVKTIEERTIYGGFANTILDPCYHAVSENALHVSLNLHELIWMFRNQNE